MKYAISKQDGKAVIRIKGWLDSQTAPELDKFVRSSLTDVTDLVFDLSELKYISSAGLRVLLYASKVMLRQGSMKVTGCSDEILEIFEITGFSEILTIELGARHENRDYQDRQRSARPRSGHACCQKIRIV